MNEIDEIRALDCSRPVELDDLDRARDRLAAAIDADTRRRRRHPRRASRHARLAGWTKRRLAIASGVVAAVAVMLMVVLLPPPAPSRQAHTGPFAAVAIQPAAFLQKAADAARADADFVPRPDQFLYVQQTGYQAWISMDGTHDGLVDNGDKIPTGGCRDGEQLVAGNYVGLRPQPCTPDPAYLADAPITPTSMIDYIVSHAGSTNPNSIGKEIIDISEFHYLRPAARAALYDAAGRLPGISMTATTLSNSGKPATAITWAFNGEYRTVLLFDPATYAYLGSVTAGVTDALKGPLNYKTGVVDAVGDLP